MYQVGKKYEWSDDGTVGGSVREIKPRRSKRPDVCDSCLLLAYDEGIRGRDQDRRLWVQSFGPTKGGRADGIRRLDGLELQSYVFRAATGLHSYSMYRLL
jgi:hypothetical protein